MALAADAVALVIRSGPNELDRATRARDTFAGLNDKVVGVIINGVADSGDEGTGYRLYPASQGLRLEPDVCTDDAASS
jgi:hypothetical protein